MSRPAIHADLATDRVRQRPGGRSARTRAQVLAATREEILDRGYAAISHRAVAQRAGVDPATVYRRWPTRPELVVDALLEVAADAVPVPDTGRLAGDLGHFLAAVGGALATPGLLRLFHALSAAGAEAGPDLAETLQGFWRARFAGAEAMFTRATDRGELTGPVDAHATIEHLVAPLYFRALVTRQPLDDAFLRACVERALAAVGAGDSTEPSCAAAHVKDADAAVDGHALQDMPSPTD